MEGYSKQMLLHKDGNEEIWLCLEEASGHKAVQHLFYHESGIIEIYRILQKIHQKNLPSILAIQPLDSGFAVLEEYIEGVPVGELLLGGRSFTEKEICTFALHLCAALKALHQNGIIHRDIKPGNLIMKPSGELVLIDFDASRFYNPHQEKDTVVLGTEGYAAPEQYGFVQTDFRTDIYAFGITIKELLANQGSSSLQKILDKCTAIDPAQRYQTISELEKAFRLKSYRKIGRLILAFATVMICVGIYSVLHNSQFQPSKELTPAQVDTPPLDDARFEEAFIALPASHQWDYTGDGTAYFYTANEMKFNPTFTFGPYGDMDDAFVLTSPSKVREIAFSGKDAACFSYMERAQQQADGLWKTKLLFLKHLPTAEEKSYAADATVTFEDNTTMLIHCNVTVINSFVIAGNNPPRDFYVGKATEISVLVQDDVPDTYKYAYTWQIIDGQGIAGFSPDAGSPEDIEVTHEAKEGKSDSILIYGHQPGTFTVQCMASGIVNGKMQQCGYLLPNVTVH